MSDTTDKEAREHAVGIVKDLVADLLYYGRKESEEMPVGKLEKLLTLDEIVAIFREELGTCHVEFKSQE